MSKNEMNEYSDIIEQLKCYESSDSSSWDVCGHAWRAIESLVIERNESRRLEQQTFKDAAFANCRADTAESMVAQLVAEATKFDCVIADKDFEIKALETKLKNLEQILYSLEYIEESLDRPLYRSLEVGFRHSPLSPKEVIERYKETCEMALMDVKSIKSLVKELVEQND